MAAANRAPAAGRALAILDLLASRPAEPFTLSQIAKALNIGVGSTHALLDAMCSAGYLTRHPSRKTYRLGPSTIAVGNAALATYPVIGVARAEMRRLVDELDLECMASVPLGDELVIVAREGRPDPARPLARIGERMPLIPPLGIMFFAWADQDTKEAWLDRADPSEAPEVRERRAAVLDSARVLGFSIGVRENGEVVVVPPVAGSPERLALDAGRKYLPNYIVASAFDEHGQPSLVINLDGFRGPVSVDELLALARRILDAALVITRETHGRVPDAVQRSVDIGWQVA